MVKTVRLGDSLNYFFDLKKEVVVAKYDPNNKDLVLVVRLDDGSILNIENREIHQEYGGVLYFDYLSDRYMIDDGYQDSLVRCGYIVFENFDEEGINEDDKDTGLDLRAKIMETARQSLYRYATYYKGDANVTLDTPTEMVVELFTEGEENYKLTVRLSTVNSIVGKNQQRKINQLPYYPFNKKMDKYGTIYLSIFGQRTSEEVGNSEEIAQDMLAIYKGAEATITELVNTMNEKTSEGNKPFHYVSNVIKKRIINWKGL